MVAPLASVSVASVPPEFSEKLEKAHEPRSSTASVVAKPEISPQKAVGSVRSSVPPPVKPIFWEPTVVLVETAASNSKVEAPEIVSVPVPVTALMKSSVADVTSIVPVLVTAGAIALVAVPPVFSNRPALAIWDAVEAPSPIPLSSRMS